MNPVDVADRVEAFLRVMFEVSASDARFSRTINLFEMGYIDSVGYAELIEFIHQEFDVEIPEDDLLSDEFSSIAGMACIVSRLGTRQPSSSPPPLQS